MIVRCFLQSSYNLLRAILYITHVMKLHQLATYSFSTVAHVGPIYAPTQYAMLRRNMFSRQLYSRVPVAYLLRFAHRHRSTFSQFFASLLKCAVFRQPLMVLHCSVAPACIKYMYMFSNAIACAD